MMQVMMNALQQMPEGKAEGGRYSVLMGNSLMFQAFPEHEGYSDPSLSGFFGLAMPLLKLGQPVGITHIENLGSPKALDGVEVLLMTYSNMKPLDPEAHHGLAEWVKGGGKLIYSATDTDPFQSVQEWWNTGGNAFKAPSDHLFSLLGVGEGAPEGLYGCGRGKLYVLRHDPKEYVLVKGGEKALLDVVEGLSGPIKASNCLSVERGPYKIVAVMDESVSPDPFVAEGCLIDLYDPDLPVCSRKEIRPGSQGFFYDVRKAGKAPKVLAAASRAYGQTRSGRSFSYVSKGPAETWNVTRVLLPREPVRVAVDGEELTWTWDKASRTCFLKFPNRPDGAKVEIEW